MLQHPFAPGSRVQWLRGDRTQSGTVAARLVGRFRPDVAPVNTFIIQIDGGGLELFPEHALNPEPTAGPTPEPTDTRAATPGRLDHAPGVTPRPDPGPDPTA